MKYTFLIITLVLVGSNFITAQLVNDGAQITVQSEATIHCQGDFIHQNGLIQNEGLIEVGKDWINNGDNNPITIAAGIIDLVGTTQSIGGSTESTFYHLDLNGPGQKILNQNTTIQQQLNLVDAELNLNENRLINANSASNSITRNEGFIRSESDLNYGWIQWNIGTNSDTYEIPFGNTDAYIPLTIDITNIGMGNGNLSFATYPTTSDNNPLPAGVSNLDINGEDDALRMADRFWLIEEEGYMTSPTSNIHFVYDENDILSPNTIDPSLMQVAQWSTLLEWDTLNSTVIGTEVSTNNLDQYGVFTLRSPDETTGIFSPGKDNIDFQVYPNPIQAANPIIIELNSVSTETALLYLINQQGQIINQKKKELLNGRNLLSFAIPADVSGNYYLVVETDGQMGIKKLFISL